MNQLFPTNKIDPLIELTPEQQSKVEFAMSIDFAPLQYHILSQIGTHIEMESVELTMVKGEILLNFSTSCALSGAGFFAKVMKSCKVISFGSGIKTDVLDDFITEEFRYWASVSVCYQNASGGENCMSLAHAVYTTSKGWVYSPVTIVQGSE